VVLLPAQGPELCTTVFEKISSPSSCRWSYFLREYPGTVDKGGEDLHGAVLLHGELLLQPEGVPITVEREERISIVQSFFIENFSEGGPTT
jgi:hypothetical protein